MVIEVIASNGGIEMQDSRYVAWVDVNTGGAFFNPAGLFEPAIGERQGDAVAAAVGELAKIQSVVDSINATLPPGADFESLLA